MTKAKPYNNGHVLANSPTDDDKLGFAEPAARLADKIPRFPADKPMVVMAITICMQIIDNKNIFILPCHAHQKNIS